MFYPEWYQKINWKKGLYLSKNNIIQIKENKIREIIKNNIEEKTKIELEKTQCNEINRNTKYETDTESEIDIEQENKNESENKINIIKDYNFKFNISRDIPYYIETIDYMNSINNNKKYDNNYYHLLDKIGSVSKFILKGDDYYKSYINKNSNKYL